MEEIKRCQFLEMDGSICNRIANYKVVGGDKKMLIYYKDNYCCICHAQHAILGGLHTKLLKDMET